MLYCLRHEKSKNQVAHVGGTVYIYPVLEQVIIFGTEKLSREKGEGKEQCYAHLFIHPSSWPMVGQDTAIQHVSASGHCIPVTLGPVAKHCCFVWGDTALCRD